MRGGLTSNAQGRLTHGSASHAHLERTHLGLQGSQEDPLSSRMDRVLEHVVELCLLAHELRRPLRSDDELGRGVRQTSARGRRARVVRSARRKRARAGHGDAAHRGDVDGTGGRSEATRIRRC